ncbi:hypothetical protein [Flagellimonas pelagia]|uniref:Uncharacterized protein n=1 Tax=Flagellimonas pelagia TaxID=2306998 RepID=A0A3A1NPR4_9FLAO|nr:hypothetical protein [Allomuricauda maritima]MCR9263040.1 hypothetical protein [Flavobacteriaceae bacterium]RIV47535.1 hypothetical protein D2V05_00080 [Allomuricauda maritima]TXK01624.1 hypothetical protein FQ017_00075 [Allomuricauda maritima]
MNLEKPVKSFDEVSITFIVLIFISIIFSISIALMADISASSGHGGLIYVIGPTLVGLLLIVIYLVVLITKPQWKYIFGTAFIIANLITGFIFMNTTF